MKILTLNEMKLHNGQHGCILGQTGTGKSVLAYNLLPKTGNVAVIDPKRMFKFDAEIYHKPSDILRDKPKRFIYQPSENLIDDLSAYDAVYKYVYLQKNFTVYTDEILGVMNGAKYPKYLKICYQLGRQRLISCLSCSQRPASIPLFIISEASKFYAFKLMLEKDIKRVSEFCKNYDDSRIPDKHTFLYFDVYESETSKPVKLNV